MAHPTESLERRLDRLERQNRRIRTSAIATAIAAVLLMASMGQSDRRPSAGANIVEAERFVLRDASGVVRARLSADAQGRTSLTLLDKSERSRVALGIAADGAPILVFGDADGRTTRMELSVRADGAATIGIGDGKGRFRTTLETNADGSAHVYMIDADGKPRSDFCILADGSPQLSLADADGKTRTRLVCDAREGAPGLFMLDQDGLARASVGQYPDKTWGVALADGGRKNRARFVIGGDGSPALSLSDGEGRVRTGLNVFADSSNLMFYDATGKSRIQIGVWPDGLPAFNLYDPQGETLWSTP